MTFYTDVLGNRILQHITARTSASSADNAVVKNWPATSKFIYAATIGFNGKDTAASTYKVQWQDDAAPGFVDIAATGAIKWAATSDVLTNGTALTEANHRCSSQAADMTWENGEEIVAASLSDSINLSSDCYTEVQFALDPAGATVGHTYSLRLYSTAEGTVPGGGTFSGCLKILHTVTLTSPTVAVTAPAITFNLNKNISIDAQTISVACPAVTPNQDVYCINLVESTVSISAPNVGLKYKDPALWPPFFIQLKAAIVAKNVYIEVGAISITPPDIEYLRDYILDLAQSDISITAPDITCSKEYTATIDQSVSIDIVAPNISYI